jgi:hypothetical protein
MEPAVGLFNHVNRDALHAALFGSPAGEKNAIVTMESASFRSASSRPSKLYVRVSRV